MNPQELEDNLRRFNDASVSAQDASGRLIKLLEASDADPEVYEALTAFLGFVDVMISTSGELIGVTGPMAPKQA